MTDIEIQKYYQKDGAYVTNLDKYAYIVTHWIALYALYNDAIYFDSFVVEHMPKEIKGFIGNKSIKTSVYRIKANISTMCGYFALDLFIL